PAIKRAATRRALAIGARPAARRVDGRGLSAGTRLMKRLAQVLALRTMLDKFGLTRVRYAYTGGAPLGPEIFGFFRAIGLNLKQVYGQTESSGICVLHPDTDVRAETLGKPTPGRRVRVSESGEMPGAGASGVRESYTYD